MFLCKEPRGPKKKKEDLHICVTLKWFDWNFSSEPPSEMMLVLSCATDFISVFHDRCVSSPQSFAFFVIIATQFLSISIILHH